MPELRGAAVVSHGGGPTTVLNASLAGVISEARSMPVITKLWGARAGMRGLLDDDLIDIGEIASNELEQLRLSPGSAIGSSRMKPPPDGFEQLLNLFERRGVRYFYYTGGNGSMETALQLHAYSLERGYELRVIGIPKTIDNDLNGTDHSPGHASAARFFAHAARDVGADNAALPPPVGILEVLGRNAGWIVAATALARSREDDAPHLIYFPERPVSEDALLADIERVYRRRGRVLLAVCEGQLNDRGEPFGAEVDRAQSSVHRLASNLGHTLARLVTTRTGLRARAEKPGLLGRSCCELASEVDRLESFECGRTAVRASVHGESGVMVGIRRVSNQPYRAEYEVVPLATAARRERLFPAEWIAREGTDVLPDYFQYIRPLVGEVKPHFRF
ncbi:MAG: diphosphate--fructose-6-phosphate 1-phosphotransferase [Bryobacteraceae bacterium]